MTDMPIDIAALVADEDELVFGEVEAPPPANDDAHGAPRAKKPRRAPKKGSEAAADPGEAAPTASAAPAPAAAAEPADAPAPVPRPGDAPAGSPVPTEATPAPTPAPSLGAKDRRGLVMGAALALSIATSCASLGGLIAVGHSLAALNAERAHASEQASAMARIAPLVEKLDDASTHLSAAAARASASTPASLDDLHHAVDDLKLVLARQQAGGGGSAVTATIQGGFIQTNERLARIEQTLDDQRAHVVVTPVHAAR